jgi:hypothetical protein
MMLTMQNEMTIMPPFISLFFEDEDIVVVTTLEPPDPLRL